MRGPVIFIDNYRFQEPRGGSGRKLSQILLSYYCACSCGENVNNRFGFFKKNGIKDLKDQVKRFAVNYAYVTEWKIDALFTFSSSEAEEATEDFIKWLDEKVKEEAENNK
ncbi:MAG: hypothetical protein AAF669_06545 [Pseudomonadota bacterium]